MVGKVTLEWNLLDRDKKEHFLFSTAFGSALEFSQSPIVGRLSVGVKQNTQLRIGQRLKPVELYFHFPNTLS
jgi:hypothetical protein